jgi:hypothetical protein
VSFGLVAVFFARTDEAGGAFMDEGRWILCLADYGFTVLPLAEASAVSLVAITVVATREIRVCSRESALLDGGHRTGGQDSVGRIA